MSSKRRIRRRSCQGKMAYPTQKAAVWNAGRLRREHQGGTWAAYRCRWCGKWHVGRPSAAERRSMRARRAGEAG